MRLEALAGADPSKATPRAQARPKCGVGVGHVENDKTGGKFAKNYLIFPNYMAWKPRFNGYFTLSRLRPFWLDPSFSIPYKFRPRVALGRVR
jgi:hypothetical protein